MHTSNNQKSRTPLNHRALSSDRNIVLQANLVRLHTFLGIHVDHLTNHEFTHDEKKLEQLLLALSDTLDVFYNRGV